MHPGDSQTGEAMHRESGHPRTPGCGESCALGPTPLWSPVPGDPGKVGESCLRGRGRRFSCLGRGRLRVGRGRPGAQAPPPAPAGRDGEAVAGAEQARSGGERGGGGRPGTRQHRAAPSGSERAGRQRGHVCDPSSRACLPRAPSSPFINSPPAPRLPGAGARRERRAAARPPPMGRAPRR